MSSAYDQNNIFAKILRSEIPAHRVWESETILAFLDVMPQADGHTLIVPKAASRNLLDADPSVFPDLMRAAQIIAGASLKAFAADGCTLMQFNEQAAGQTVFHLHFHVIPRHDGIPLRPHSGTMEKPEVLAANAEKLRRALSQ